MRVGYSFWGFLGPGITDTPDGGRSHRRTLIDGLRARGYETIFLQLNRDLHEANDDFTATYQWDEGLPEIDALFLEWRWPIPGRNTTTCGTSGHTCDLHRQTEIVRHYVSERGVPTLLWDKDQQLPANDPLRAHGAITVCEPALLPHAGARSLLFPVEDAVLETTDPVALSGGERDLPLVYVGNQYDRDDAFDRYFAVAAAHHEHAVAGKWTRTQAWPHVAFIGRCSFAEVERLHKRAVSTILLTPHRYVVRGQITQRLFEAVLAGCLPIGPAEIRGIDHVLPESLIVNDGKDAAALIDRLLSITGTPHHPALLADCLRRMTPFKLSRQLAVVDSTLNPTGPVRREGEQRDAQCP